MKTVVQLSQELLPRFQHDTSVARHFPAHSGRWVRIHDVENLLKGELEDQVLPLLAVYAAAHPDDADAINRFREYLTTASHDARRKSS
jgi:hypothetical protein